MADMLYDAATIDEALERMAATIRQQSPAGEPITIIGILRGGARVADALQKRLETVGCATERGDLDISFYRDDLDTIGPHPEVRPSRMPFDINGRHIWLVDDVLYTGRTIRAALGELFDYGRAASIRLAVLLDRGGRELPICAEIAGLRHEAPADISVKLFSDDDHWHIEQRRVR
jgi:pyrimidine operon attenuation protein/uracil phosphoribosyltransferase